jgi:hypothetical protein
MKDLLSLAMIFLTVKNLFYLLPAFGRLIESFEANRRLNTLDMGMPAFYITASFGYV